jgi:hypothetical protein
VLLLAASSIGSALDPLRWLDDGDSAGRTSMTCFEASQKSYATRLEEELAIEAAFNDLVAEVLLILSRLLGRDIAERIGADAHL